MNVISYLSLVHMTKELIRPVLLRSADGYSGPPIAKPEVVLELLENVDAVLQHPKSPRQPVAQEGVLGLFDQSQSGLVSRAAIVSLFEHQVSPVGTADKVISRLNERLGGHGFEIRGAYYYQIVPISEDIG